MWQRGGWVGVDLFFVLSGFLVSGLLFAEYKSRGRLLDWPLLHATGMENLSTVLYAHRRHGDSQAAGRPTGDCWHRRSPSFKAIFPGLLGHTWSLAVEEHFYLLLPLVLILIAEAEPGLDYAGSNPSSLSQDASPF